MLQTVTKIPSCLLRFAEPADLRSGSKYVLDDVVECAIVCLVEATTEGLPIQKPRSCFVVDRLDERRPRSPVALPTG